MHSLKSATELSSIEHAGHTWRVFYVGNQTHVYARRVNVAIWEIREDNEFFSAYGPVVYK